MSCLLCACLYVNVPNCARKCRFTSTISHNVNTPTNKAIDMILQTCTALVGCGIMFQCAIYHYCRGVDDVIYRCGFLASQLVVTISFSHFTISGEGLPPPDVRSRIILCTRRHVGDRIKA